MSDKEKTQISGLLITGLLAIISTVAGGIIKGCMETNLARYKFQAELVSNAMNKAEDERFRRLTELVNTNVISEKKIRSGIEAYINKSTILNELYEKHGKRITLKIHEYPFHIAPELSRMGQIKANDFCKDKFDELKEEGNLKLDPNRYDLKWGHLFGEVCVANQK